MSSKRKKEEYSPADICKLFAIARSTLFRWEAVGQIPKTERNEKGERVYNPEHLEKILMLVKKRTRNNLMLARSGTVTAELAAKFCEQKHTTRFVFAPIAEKEAHLLWLKHYAEHKLLSEESVKLLSQEAINRPIGDDFRKEILSLLVQCEETYLQRIAQRRNRD